MAGCAVTVETAGLADAVELADEAPSSAASVEPSFESRDTTSGRASDPEFAGERGFIVELPEFSGPLDLLLSLIRDEQVDIYDIPVARVAEQFLARIHGMPIDEAAEYLEMAARLLRIKAQMLLPRPDGAEQWEDPRAELVRRLLEYQQVREVVDVLERLGDDRRNRFARSYVQVHGEPVERDDRPFAATLADLFAAVDRVLRQATRPIIHDVIPRALDVDGAMRSIREVMARRTRARWGDIVPRDAEPWQILSVLLALLELAKSGELRIAQAKPFASMELSGDTAS